ncbi:unnamed protein product [Penicillium olsonii]|uniref:RRM domain-containing protein n=1 Tax=Penicillium olsonii TaxID=99116 RepID=A0A9W4I697_PENOL|nr:unnamed protein product [Penicillium olsonii]CAG8012271.1 unnamed protein product [Penicillium olsonii]CAG8226462.1 unnamed protein product [Penicillium olsonii]
MANTKSISFDDIIKADRQKKKQEELANQLLGKNRRSSAPGSGSGANRKDTKSQTAKPGSLASRIGVAKRTSSATGKASNTPSPSNVRSRGKATKDRVNADQVQRAFNSNGNLNQTRGDAQYANNRNNTFSIKGASGPFVVIGTNFAPGTTAADIQSAFEPTTGPILSCRIVANSPAIVAEITFTDKSTAELAVANFHNQRADGRILKMNLKSNSTPKAAPADQNHFAALRAQADRDRVRARRGQGQQPDLLAPQNNSQSGLYSDEMMVDAPAENTQKKNNQRRGRR